jgi:mannose-1-phosphate guanylyltransferase
MLPIGGRPLLAIWLDALADAGVDDVLVNLHHLSDSVRGFLDGYEARTKVRSVFEPELLGSAGTLVSNRDWVADEDFFLVCNADNLTDFDVRKLVAFHLEGDVVATWTVFQSEDPSACGVVELDDEARVVGFVEKPRQPVSNLCNAGIYAFHPSVLAEVVRLPPQDIGFDLLPRLVGRSRAIPVGGYFRDIGTREAYRRAREEWIPKVKP